MSKKIDVEYLQFLEESKKEDKAMLLSMDSFKKSKGRNLEEQKRNKAINDLIDYKKAEVSQRIEYVTEEINSYLDTIKIKEDGLE